MHYIDLELPGPVYEVFADSAWVVLIFRATLYRACHKYQDTWELHLIRLCNPYSDVHPTGLCHDLPVGSIHAMT